MPLKIVPIQKEKTILRKSGKSISGFDLVIASTCISHELIMVTENIKEFERVLNITI